MSVLLPTGLVYGAIAPALLRDLAKNLLKIEAAEIDDLRFLLGASRAEVMPVWEGMKTDGWIVQKDGAWVPSENIRTLSNARIGKPLSRTKADALLAQLIANAQMLNALPPDEPRTYWITKIAVFGSYLSDKETLGDLDIAWAIADRSSTKFWGVKEMMYGRDSVSPTRARFRPRSPYISLIDYEKMIALECPYRDVYSFEPPAAA